jgi:hypothetical protein
VPSWLCSDFKHRLRINLVHVGSRHGLHPYSALPPPVWRRGRALVLRACVEERHKGLGTPPARHLLSAQQTAEARPNCAQHRREK